ILDDLLFGRREFTEQWAHEASIIPVETWPLLRHRMEKHRVRTYNFESVMATIAEYMERVLEEVRTRGPLTSDDFTPPVGVARIEGAWFGSVPRAVLEAFFGRGVLAVAERRPNFARAYDLAERIVAAEHFNKKVDHAESQRE